MLNCAEKVTTHNHSALIVHKHGGMVYKVILVQASVHNKSVQQSYGFYTCHLT